MNAHQSLLRFRSEFEIRRANWSKSKLITLIVGIDLQCIHVRCISNIIIRISCRAENTFDFVVHVFRSFASESNCGQIICTSIYLHFIAIISLSFFFTRSATHLYAKKNSPCVVLSLSLSLS